MRTPELPSSDIPTSKGRPWLAWVSLGIVALATFALVTSSIAIRNHAEQRRNILTLLADIETMATAQSTIVWRAMTLKMAEDQHGFIRLRGEEQSGRTEIYERLATLKELEDQGQHGNERLGITSPAESLRELEAATNSFLGGIQGVFGQMTLDVHRVRDRLRYWDMNFGTFCDALYKVKQQDEEIAQAAASLAHRATTGAAIMTLVATGFAVLQISRMRSRQARELQAQRFRTLSSSEARFRALVQYSNDLIFVTDKDGRLQYASPSAEIFTPSLPAIQPYINEGFLHEHENSSVTIDQVFGQPTVALLQSSTTEIAVPIHSNPQTFDVHTSDLTDNPHVRGLVFNAHNITERKSLEQQLRHQATHDPLTGLPNRRGFLQRFEALDSTTRRGASVCFLDLDGFKLVNDSYGHAVGDQLLVVAASRIAGCLGEQDVLARQGGDEFLALLHGDPSQSVQRILKALTPPFVMDGKEVFVSASVGVVKQIGKLTAEEVTQRADIAMYAAKEAGKAQASFFEESMLGGAAERLQLESDFRKALERREFTVVYQPKVSLNNQRTESLEALVRWQHPTRGYVRPDEFIPFAEESGLIAELGQQVLEQACRDAVRWQERGVIVAVNLSPIQFRNPDLAADIGRVLAETGLDPQHLELEITESAVLGDVNNTIRMLNELKSLGIRLAIDDFGTGYSNLSHLKHFNVDVLKIDQAFVRGGNPGSVDQLSDAEIVKAVIGMAKAFGLHVVAEGVESESHVEELHALGADLGQGYYFSKPVSGEAIDELLARESLQVT